MIVQVNIVVLMIDFRYTAAEIEVFIDHCEAVATRVSFLQQFAGILIIPGIQELLIIPVRRHIH